VLVNEVDRNVVSVKSLPVENLDEISKFAGKKNNQTSYKGKSTVQENVMIMNLLQCYLVGIVIV
jgi:hypothetical protein